MAYKKQYNYQEKRKEIIENLSEEERLLYGKKRAMRLLERKDYSRKELTERLLKDGYKEELVESILEYLDGYHYLDDVRVAGSYIRSVKEYKSKKELEYKLKQKGIREEDIAEAIEENYKNEDGTSQEEIAIKRQLLKYHITEEVLDDFSYEEKQKIAAKLYRKGFGTDKIRKELQM